MGVQADVFMQCDTFKSAGCGSPKIMHQKYTCDADMNLGYDMSMFREKRIQMQDSFAPVFASLK